MPVTPKRITHFIRARLASTLLLLLCLVHVPPGFTQVSTNSIVAQVLSQRELDLLIEKADQFEQAGDYESAAEIWEQIVKNDESVFGFYHPETAMSLNNLAFLYATQGLYGKAEPLYERALEINEKALGGDHPHTATSLNNLASLYESQGLYGKAGPLYERALEINEKVLGGDHPDTAMSLNNLAGLYASQGLYGKAESLYERALEINEKVLGGDHPHTATSLNNLAGLYESQGLYGKAGPLYERALEINEKVLGADYPDTAMSLNNLAGLYASQGLYGKAEPLYERALEINEKVLGADHPDTSMSMNNLAGLYQSQGLYDKAEPLYEQALEIREKVLGADHPDTAMSMNNLAHLYQSQGLYGKAESLYERALEINEKVLGSDHPDTSMSLNNLAGLYQSQGLYGKAESLYERALEIDEKVLGGDHPDTAVSLSNLALLYQSQGLYGKAEPLYERALVIREKALGGGHPGTAISLNNLAALYESQGLYGKAEPLYERALVIREKALGGDHPHTATSLNNLAGLYASQGLYDNAESLYERALEINEKALGGDHPGTATSLNNLALLYQSQDLHSKAEPLYERALEISEKALGMDHPDTAISLNNLALLYQSQDLHSKAEPLYERALEINEKTLGENHLEMAMTLNNLAGFYDSQGLYDKSEPFWRRAISAKSIFIQREAPYLPRDDRQAFASSFGFANEMVFSYILQRSGGAELALFSRLNHQGLLEEIEHRQSQLNGLTGEQKQMVRELRVLTQKLSSLVIKPSQRQALKVRQDELEKQLYRLLPQLKPRVVQVEQVAVALPIGAALIEFQRYKPFDGKRPKGERWGKAKYLAMVLKSNRSIEVVDLGYAEVIDNAISQAVEGIENQLSDVPELMAKVSQLLIEPLNAATAGASTWFVSPDGELNRLPFAALPVGAGESGYLGETVNLRLVTTGRELLDLQKPKAAASNDVLLVVDPAYGKVSEAVMVASNGRAYGETRSQRSADLPDQLQWARLPATAKEGKAIQALIGGELWMREQATAEAVKRSSAPKVLHLATHAFYLPDLEKKDPPLSSRLIDQRGSVRGAVRTASLQGESPLLRSGIAMAGANQPNANPNDDGYLTALEVAQLDWDGTELVVISACESGRGEIRSGEGVYGLKRAIAVAGARSSLLSLWKVDDSATAAFMESFYQRLKEGKGKADALAETQKEFRNHPIPMWREPYVWAAFQLSGDWGPVKGL